MPPSKANQAQRISPDAGSGARTAKASKDSGSYGSRGKDPLEAYIQAPSRAVSAYRQRWRVLVLLMVVVAMVAGGHQSCRCPGTPSRRRRATTPPSASRSASPAATRASSLARQPPSPSTPAAGSRPVTWVRPVRGVDDRLGGARAQRPGGTAPTRRSASARAGAASPWPCRAPRPTPPLRCFSRTGDASHPSVSIGQVTIGSLSTAPANTPLPSLSVHLVGATVRAGTSLRLFEGSVHARGASLAGDTRLVVTGGGSVRVHEVAAARAEPVGALRPAHGPRVLRLRRHQRRHRPGRALVPSARSPPTPPPCTRGWLHVGTTPTPTAV